MAKLTGPVLATPAQNSLSRFDSEVIAVGTKAFSADGEYVFVKAGGAITASGDPVSASGTLSAVLRGDLDVGGFIGVAEAPFASGEYGWVKTKGTVDAVVASGTTVGQELQLSATVGQLKAITTSGTAVAVALAANAGAAAKKSVFLR